MEEVNPVVVENGDFEDRKKISEGLFWEISDYRVLDARNITNEFSTEQPSTNVKFFSDTLTEEYKIAVV